MSIDVGLVAGVVKRETAPTETSIIWAKVLNPSFPNVTELHTYDEVSAVWKPLELRTDKYPVTTIGLNTPAVSPNEGDAYVVGDTPTGAWVGREKNHAVFIGGVWNHTGPIDGISVALLTVTGVKLYFYREGSVNDWVYSSGDETKVPLSGTVAPITGKLDNSQKASLMDDFNDLSLVDKKTVVEDLLIFGKEYHYHRVNGTQSNSTATELTVLTKQVTTTAGYHEGMFFYGFSADNTSRAIVVRFYVDAVLVYEAKHYLSNALEVDVRTSFSNILYTAGTKTVTMTLATVGGGGTQTSNIINPTFKTFKTDTPL